MHKWELIKSILYSHTVQLLQVKVDLKPRICWRAACNINDVWALYCVEVRSFTQNNTHPFLQLDGGDVPHQTHYVPHRAFVMRCIYIENLLVVFNGVLWCQIMFKGSLIISSFPNLASCQNMLRNAIHFIVISCTLSRIMHCLVASKMCLWNLIGSLFFYFI